MPHPTPILLLKTKSTPTDGYEDFFTKNNYSPSFIPVLEHRFHHGNLARVRGLFASGAFDGPTNRDDLDDLDDLSLADTNGNRGDSDRVSRRYGGMIFTSQRAVEAFADMIERDGCMFHSSTLISMSILRSIGRAMLTVFLTVPNTYTTSDFPFYTVGPATARSLQSLRDKYLPNATIHGADAGNGENLARFILDHYNAIYPCSAPRREHDPIDAHTSIETGPGTGTGSGTGTGTKTEESRKEKPALLFLVGEQRRDIIPKTLMSPSLPESARIPVDEIVVYETGEMDSFESDFATAVKSFQNSDQNLQGGGDVLWVVVFSPTGCEGMLRVLGLGPFGGTSDAAVRGGDGESKRRVCIATIGPTTRDFLKNRFGVEADVCAERPSPDGVGEGIRRFMELRNA